MCSDYFINFFSTENKESITRSLRLFRADTLPSLSPILSQLYYYIHTVALCSQYDEQRTDPPHLYRSQLLVSPSRWPIWQRLTAFSPSLPAQSSVFQVNPEVGEHKACCTCPPCQKKPTTTKPLCAHYDLGPCFLNPFAYLPTTPHPCLLTPLLCRVYPPLVPTASRANLTSHQLFLY